MDDFGHKVLKIALDYDDTFTADRGMWQEIVKVMQKMGHEVTFVTFRSEDMPSRGNNDDILEDAKELGLPVVFSNHKQKAHVFKADIWIDDMPVLIPSYKDMVGMTVGCEVSKDTEALSVR